MSPRELISFASSLAQGRGFSLENLENKNDIYRRENNF
jgi:hypothetical protein